MKPLSPPSVAIAKKFSVRAGPRSLRKPFFALGSLSLLAMVTSLAAQNLYWDTDNATGLQAGAGNWDKDNSKNGGKRWSDVSGNSNPVSWTDGNNAFFTASGTSLVTVTDTITVNSMTFDGTGYTIALETGKSLTLTGPNITTNQAATISAAMGGTVGLTKSGSATLTLSNANTYTGTTTISAGTLLYGANNVINTGAVTVNGSTAILDLGASRTDSVGTVTLQDGGQINGTGTSALTSTGTFEMQSGSVGVILAGSGIALNKMTAGTVTLSGANTYTGLTTVSAGTLLYGASNVINTGAVTVNGSTAILDLGANRTDTVGTVTLQGGGQINGSGTSALTSTGTFEMQSGSVGVILAGSGVALNKTTAGTVTLTTANTYTGATTINQGTLLVSGSIGSSAVTVNNAGTVLASGTTGTIGNSVTVNTGAILAAGGTGTIGTATVGSGGLTMNAGSIFSWDVTSASNFDKVTVAALSGPNAIFNIVTNISDPFWNGNRTFSGIFSGTTNLADIFSSIRLNGSTLTGGLVPGRGTFAFDSSVNLKYTAIPEPTSALAGILLVGGLLRRRR